MNIIDLQYIDYLQSSVILISYLSPVLYPYSALSVFSDWRQISTVYHDSTLRTPYATCIFMSHTVSLAKTSPVQIWALQMVGWAGN